MNHTPALILAVDDDPAIRTALRFALSGLSFQVDESTSGEDACKRVMERAYQAVLLDVNMPGLGGVECCRRLRNIAPLLPILMLTVLDRQDDLVAALDAGADDYITKPFQIKELAARLRAAVRRTQLLPQQPKLLTEGDVQLDPDRRLVTKRGVAVHLTPKEFDLLYQLMSRTGMPVTHAKLLRSVWGPEYGGELEYLRTFIRQLRVKLEDDASRPKLLHTEPHVGYRFSQNP